MTDPAVIFAEWLGIRPAAGRILAALHRRPSAVVSMDALRLAAGQTFNGVNFSLRQLRAAMDPGAIECIFREGHALSPVGVAECELALADAAARERAA